MYKEKGNVEPRGIAKLLVAAKKPAMRKHVEEIVGFVEKATEAEVEAEVEGEGKEVKAAKAWRKACYNYSAFWIFTWLFTFLQVK